MKLQRSPSRQLVQPERVPAVSLRNVSQAGYFEDVVGNHDAIASTADMEM